MTSSVLVRGGRLFDPGRSLDRPGDLWICDGRIAAVGDASSAPAGTEVVEAAGTLVTPMFTDLHVHLREPGGEESETIASGTAAALAGGFATVFAMPNTDPTADRPEVIRRVREAAARAGPCEVVPVSALTVGLKGRVPVDLFAMAAAGAGAFSDDGSWVADDALAETVFREAASLGLLVMEHCEDFAVTGPGVLHDGPETRAAGLPGIPRSAEDRATARDIALARRYRTRLHLCHVSTEGAVGLLRSAKAEGLSVTGEATPHHLVLTVADAVRGGPDFKMKPPLREARDVRALVEALADGTLDAVGTDHAPHAEPKKGTGLLGAPFGAIGLETAFPVLYTHLVRPGLLPLRRLLEALVDGPARVARRAPAALALGAPARVNVIDVSTERTVDRARLHSKSRNCPFDGMALQGWPIASIIDRTLLRHR